MAAQFDIWMTPQGDHVLILQHDLLSDLATRTVCLLLPETSPVPMIASLGPLVSAGDVRLRVVPQVMATLTLTELGQYVTNVAHDRDRIMRALDVLLTGT